MEDGFLAGFWPVCLLKGIDDHLNETTFYIRIGERFDLTLMEKSLTQRDIFIRDFVRIM